MNLDDAYENIKITPEEKESVKRYLNFYHAGINLLGDLGPSTYFNFKTQGYHLPKSETDLRKSIDDFVNIYSVMYKKTKNREYSTKVYKGTSKEHVKRLDDETKTFFSTTDKLDIAKRFCKPGDSALLKINIEKGVPILDAEEYREFDSAIESEYIVAPFCKIAKKEIFGRTGALDYYDLTLTKPILEEKEQDELDQLYEKVIIEYPQKVKDIEQYGELLEIINQLQKEARDAEKAGNNEKLKDISQKKSHASKAVSKLLTITSASDLSTNLQDLLKGLCKQKELQVDRAVEFIEENKKIAEEQKRLEIERQEAEKRENERLQKVNEMSSKISHTPKKIDKLLFTISSTYNQLLSNEKFGKDIANRLGVDLSIILNNITIGNKISEIKKNLDTIKQKCHDTNITNALELEDISDIWKEIMPLLDGVTYSGELTRDFPDIVNSHKIQVNNDIKRNLYEKVHRVLQNARIQKYTREQENIADEKVGFFGRIIGKDVLKEEKLRNVRLKIKQIKTSNPEVRTKYSVQDMLAEIYASAITEFEGQFTPEMAELFTAIRSTYVEKESQEPFSDEYISKLAMQKIEEKQRNNFPTIPNDKPSFFGKTKAKIEEVRAANYDLQIKIEENVYSGNRWNAQNKDRDFTAVFENKLIGILSSTNARQQTKDDIKNTKHLWNYRD